MSVKYAELTCADALKRLKPTGDNADTVRAGVIAAGGGEKIAATSKQMINVPESALKPGGSDKGKSDKEETG